MAFPPRANHEGSASNQSGQASDYSMKMPGSAPSRSASLNHPLVQQDLNRPALSNLHREVSTLRDSILTLRVSVNNKRKVCLRLRPEARDARFKYQKLVDETNSRGTFEQCKDQMRALWQEAKNADSELSIQEEELKELENTLTSLEYRYGGLETELFLLVQGLPLATQQEQVLSRQNSDSTEEYCEEEAAYSSSPIYTERDIPPLLAQLYSRVGDIGVLRDRLEEMRDEHHEELEHRHRSATLGNPVEPSDAEFFDDYVHSQKTLTEDLRRAEDDARALRRQCLEEGITPAHLEGMGDVFAEDLEDTVETRHAETKIQDIHPELKVGVDLTTYLIGNIIGEFQNTRDRINRWLMDMFLKDRLEHLKYLSSRGESETEYPFSETSWALVLDKWSEDDAARGPKLSSGSDSSTVSIRVLSSMRKQKTWQGDAPRRRYSDPIKEIASKHSKEKARCSSLPSFANVH